MTTKTVLALALMLGGCGAMSASPAVIAGSDPLRVHVISAPPPETSEAPSPGAPDDRQVWVAGYWDNLGGHRIWRRGHRVEAKPGYDYVPAAYEFDGRSWWFHVPHWKRHHSPLTALRQPDI